MAKRPPPPLRVLFIGNSFTARNDLPGLIARLAEAAGERLEHRLISAGGASLKRHWNAGEARRAIAEGHYDYVVLQEQSTLPIKSPARMRDSVLLFDEAIKAAGSKAALYLTWARAHAPESQDALTKAYTTVGKEIGALVIPAGVAWQRFLGKHDHPVLHDPDGSHPTLAGSYLAACVAFAALFPGRSVGLAAPLKGLTKSDMSLLQRVAASVMK